MKKPVDFFDFQKILNIKDLEAGFKRLSKKKKYRDPYDVDILLRYIKLEERKPNKLKDFIDSFKDSSGKIKKEKLSIFFNLLKKYSLDPYSAYAIPKPGKKGKYRPLLVPEAKDRLLFDSLLPLVMSELKDSIVKRNLLGLGLIRKQRVSDIVIKIHREYIQNGFHHVLILDFSSFFSLIDRKILIEKMEKDNFKRPIIEAVDYIISNKINNGKVVEDKTGVPITKNGVPQGLSFSPLLACYYALDIDDIYISEKNVVGFRYIDDIIILGKNINDLVSVYQKIKEKSVVLKMELHPIGDKSQLKCLKDETFTYLGIDVNTSSIKINEKKFEDFSSTIINDIFPKKALKGNSIQEIKDVYFSFVRGWLNHYEAITEDKESLHEKLDSIIKKYFLKDRKNRKPFYDTNKDWITIKSNKELHKKKKA